MVGFDEYFRLATGSEPYAYQRELGSARVPPAVVQVPTGSGKTQALLVSWLYQRRVLGIGPRRLAYALPMRTLVEQTASVAVSVRERLGLDTDELAIHMLMGGEGTASLSGWREHPERDQILVGTVDMLLSRALNRGYGESRFQWPIAFGLLNADTRWVLDEVQLMGPARSTSAQLDGLRAKLGVAVGCETVWASATVDREALITVDGPELGDVLTLAAADRDGPLARRLQAGKRLERVDLSSEPPARLARAIATAVLEHHEPGTLALVVLNRVELAQQVFLALERALAGSSVAPEVVLVHSRYRPRDRAEHLRLALAAIDGGAGRIVVSTQVIEAGVDVSARLLATETAPFSSIVQRLGRCNRAGEREEAIVLWLDRGDLDPRAAAPYEAADVNAARAALIGLVGQSLSPARLEELRVAESREPSAVLRRRDLLDLFDTAPDLSGLDVDVSRFIREADERSASVFFRDVDGSDDVRGQTAPDRDELVEVPLASLKGRTAWVFDFLDGGWRFADSGDRYPGATLLLRARDGGYGARLGWTGDPADRPEPVDTTLDEPPDATDDDRLSLARQWRSLPDHLADSHAAARQLLNALGSLTLSDSDAEAVPIAAALHDIGKAHPAFQQMLLSSAPEPERDGLSGTLWAKSAYAGGRHVRPHFRHELASALALWATGSAELSPNDGLERDLVAYLVAAHHGRVHLSIRPVVDERPPPDRQDAPRFALGVAEGDQLPSVPTPVGTVAASILDLACMELGGGERSWTEMVCKLRDRSDLGPFRVAYLEALVRLADWRASA